MPVIEYRCVRCNKRLPLNEVDGRAVVFCRHCKTENVIDSRPEPKFRREVVVKA